MLEIINQKYMQFLFEIARKPKNISELAKKGDLTMSVASTLISRWQREGDISKQKSEDGGRGKDIIIHLTEYGEDQVKLLKKLFENYQKNKKELLNLGAEIPEKFHKMTNISYKGEKEEKNDK